MESIEQQEHGKTTALKAMLYSGVEVESYGVNVQYLYVNVCPLSVILVTHPSPVLEWPYTSADMRCVFVSLEPVAT